MGHEDSAWALSSCSSRKVALPPHPKVTVCAKQPPPLRGLEELGPGLAGNGEGHRTSDGLWAPLGVVQICAWW